MRAVKVAIICFDGVDELDVFGPYRVFVGASDAGADVHTSLVTLLPVETITSSHGVRFEVDGTLSETDPDVLVVPGGGWNARAEASAWAEAERGDIPTEIARLHENDVIVAGVCTGSMLVARAGLVTGDPAVTHAGALDDLRQTGAIVREDRVVDAGQVVTAGGVSAGIDLALHLLERQLGEEVADTVAASIEYDRQYPTYYG